MYKTLTISKPYAGSFSIHKVNVSTIKTWFFTSEISSIAPDFSAVFQPDEYLLGVVLLKCHRTGVVISQKRLKAWINKIRVRLGNYLHENSQVIRG